MLVDMNPPNSTRIPSALQQADLTPQPLRQARALPACAYSDPEFHAFDAQVIFARTWQFIGRADQVKDPGDHLVAEIAGKPVITVRGNDGVLRAFFNVCKHRAGPLALDNGNTRFLQCRYHGWIYTLEGKLRATHEMQEAEGFEPSGICLDPVYAAEWQGLVFAAVSDPGVTLATLLDGIAERIAPIELAALSSHARVTYELHCNWKVYVDNYLEGYHLPYVHPQLNKLLDYRNYTTHIAEWYSWQQSPVSGGAGLYAAGQAQYYFVFPNLMLNILPGRLQINQVIPISQHHCCVFFDYYYADTQSASAKKLIADDMNFSDEVQREDIAICERVQQGLESGAYTAGRLSPKRESGVHHFQELVRKAYRQALTGKD